MKLSAFIIDDELPAINVLATYIERTPWLEFAGSATDPLQALDTLTTGLSPTLTFLDIDMPLLSGLEMANLIRHMTTVVFTTSYREYGPEAYEKNVFDYLLKPISYARFLKCAQRYRDQQVIHHQEPPHHFFVKGNTKGTYIKIHSADILYIESALNYVDIFTTTSRITAYLTMAEILEKLPADIFCRVHRRFIVNQNRITSIEQPGIRLDNQIVIPLGNGFREAFFKRIGPAMILSYRAPQS